MSSEADSVVFTRPSHGGGLELLTASYAPRSFPTHVHPELVIGAITEGAERLTMRGRDWHAGMGSVLVIPPGEAHANSAIGVQRMGYCVLYVPAETIAQTPLQFAAAVRADPTLFRAVVSTHRGLMARQGAMEQQTLLAGLLRLVADRGAADHEVEAAPARLRAARDFLEAYFRDNCSLADVAAAAGLSSFHLARSYRAHFGLSPIAYRNQLRVMEARRLLAGGMPIADAALDVGLADQSHLTRQFQRVMGTTPGRYAQQ